MEATHQSQFAPPHRISFHWGRAANAVAALAAGLVLRLWMLQSLFLVNGDSLIYGGLAKTLLRGHYELNRGGGAPVPTFIRLPGYPLFLALNFKLFGMENYFAAVLVQIALELLGCLLLAQFATRIAPLHLKRGAWNATLWLAALCPFTASYAIFPLAEAPTLFAFALALWAMARFHDRPGWSSALWFTFAVTFAALLRPDGALVAVALAPAMLIGLPRGNHHGAMPLRKLTRIAAVCLLLALAPFTAWTWRNWQVFHVFQPLAPRSAIDPGEVSQSGWVRWVKTWCLDFSSTYNIYWNIPDGPLDIGKLPARAFDSPAQFAETAALAEDYNSQGYNITPEIDARFASLAQQRITAHPIRYYVWLPLGRLADMVFRPRVENLNIDLDWWAYAHHNDETLFSWAYAALNALYLLLAAVGFILRPRFWKLMLAYILLRCAMLLTVEAPETRYTLQFFPILFVLGGIALYWFTNRVCLSVLKVKASLGKV